MPNAQRKKEYLRIYEDVTLQNETLVLFLAQQRNARVASALLNATNNHVLNKGGIVRGAIDRWQESRLVVRGAQSGNNGANGDGDETVSGKN